MGLDRRIAALFAERPKIVDHFPDWMLSGKRIDSLRGIQDLAMAEIAGRDSFAAILKAVEEEPIGAILPSIAYTGTEYGNWRVPFEKLIGLKERLDRTGIKVLDPVVLGDPAAWNLLCGRSIVSHIRAYGFYSPCIGCHLYLHSLRLPLARLLNIRTIISGERERHDGKVKLNQLGTVLDAYTRLLDGFGVRLLLPLRYVNSGEEIKAILREDWREGEEQLRCVLSKNYVDEQGRVPYDEKQLRRFLDEFALPTARSWLENLSG